MSTPAAINELVRSFLQKDSLEECSVIELQQLTRNYPYASAAQLLLAEKLKMGTATGAERQLEKTSLYFHGPLWQNNFSEGKGEAVISSGKKETVPVVTDTVEEPPMIPALAASEHEEEEGIPTLAAISDEVVITDEPPVHTEENNIEIIAEPEVVTESIGSNEPVEEEITNPVASTETEVEPVKEITEEPTGITDNNIIEPEAAVPVEEEQVTEPVIVSEAETHPDTPIYEEQPLQQTEEPTIATTAGEILGTVIAEDVDQSSQPMKTEEINEQEPVPEVSGEMSGEIPGLKIEPIDPATAELSYTPFHTVDYFASQGIKFKEDDQPRDKFGKQLKSFTEWLKALKKVPGTAPTPTVTPQSEKKVEQMAAHSLSDEGEVLTEAMAEVWEKQDNPQKAIAIYEKLSLLNPGKRAYFAAKIDQLKNS